MYADISLKARCADPEVIESILAGLNADYQGLDVQTDTYYETAEGRLKHRQGNIENRLIQYKRIPQEVGCKTEVTLYLKNPSSETVAEVCRGKAVLAQVRKARKIFFIGNVKIHLDQIDKLGSFVEIEAIDLDGSVGIEVLRQQCDYYKSILQIDDEAIVNQDYIDLIKQL